jgi:nitrite reductase (NADH) small subunit
MRAAREAEAEWPADDVEWEDVCPTDAILPGTGAAALVGREQIALVRTRSGDVYAISNFDPFSRAFVLARGIVGDRGGRPKIASPMYKQSFDLLTGDCLDAPGVALPVYPVRLFGSRIQVGVIRRSGA